MKLSPVLTPLICHLVALVLFVLINDLGMTLYKELHGGFDTRGYAPGAATRLAIMHMLIANLLIAFIPWRALKVSVVLVTSAVLAWLLLPYHPMRAAFYCGLLVILSLTAMMATTFIGKSKNHRSPTHSGKD